MKLPNWMKLPPDITEFLGELAKDTFKALAILLSLSLIHTAVDESKSSAEFKALFNKTHESIAWATLTLVGLRGALRLIRA